MPTQVSEAVGKDGKLWARIPKAEKLCIWSIAASLSAIVESMYLAMKEIADALAQHPSIFRCLSILVANASSNVDILCAALRCFWRTSSDNLDMVQYIIAEDEVKLYDTLRERAKEEVPGSIHVLATGILHNINSYMGWHDRKPGPQGQTDLDTLQVLFSCIKNTNPIEAFYDRGEVRWERRLVALDIALEVLASVATSYLSVLQSESTKDLSRRQPTRSLKVQHREALECDEMSWNGVEDDGDAQMTDQFLEEQPQLIRNSKGKEDKKYVSSGLDIDKTDVDMETIVSPGIEASSDEEILDTLTDMPILQRLFDIIPRLVYLAEGRRPGEERDPDMAENIHQHSLDAINNIAWLAASFDYTNGQNKSVIVQWEPMAIRIWRGIVPLIFDHDGADLELTSIVASIAWAVSKSLEGHVSSSAKGREHMQFIKLYEKARMMKAEESVHSLGATEEEAFQRLTVKCIGTLGQLGRVQDNLDRNKEVGMFLLKVALDEESGTAENIQAVNEFMDMYADEGSACEKVFWANGGIVIEKLEQAQILLRAKAKAVDRRIEQELREMADEAVVNFTRFIQYKKKHCP